MSTLTRHLSHLETSGLIRLARVEPELEYLFRHALVQDAAYGSILSSDRRRLHRAVGQVVEELYSDRLDEHAATLARHFAGAGDQERARAYYRRAGDAALASFANQEAESHYREGLALTVAGADRADLLAQLGESLVRQDRFDEALDTWRQAIEICRAAGNLDGVARLYSRSARAAWYADDTPRGLALCEEGLAAVGDAPESPDQARLLHEAARAYLFNGQAGRAGPLLRQALDMARRQAALDVEADALITFGVLPDIPGDEALSALRTAVDLVHEHGLIHIAGRAHHNLGIMTGGITGDLHAAREQFREAVRIAHRRGVASEEALSSMSVFGLSMALGDIQGGEEAISRIQELLQLVPDPETIRLELHSMQAGLSGVKGDWERASELQHQVYLEAERRGNLQLVLSAAEELVWFTLEMHSLGRPLPAQVASWAEAEALVNRVLEITAAGLGSRVAPRALLSIVRVRQGRLGEARARLAEAESHARDYPSAWDDQMLRIARVELAVADRRWTDALALAEEIAAFEHERDRRWNWARALRQWAEIHVRRGEPSDLERAQGLLRQARHVYQQMGIERYATLVGERLETLRADTFARARAHGKVAQELAVAGRIQSGLLPETIPALPGWQLAAVLEPARETSGDFYDFVHLDDGLLALVIADVADKGAGAALYMALTRTLLRTALLQYPSSPARALAAANERILSDTHTDMFVTLCCAILDPETGTLTYANAGHNPPYLFAAQQARALHPTGMALGIMPAGTWQEEHLVLAPGDTLLLYTDGVVDAQGKDEHPFGLARLLQTARSNRHLPAAALVNTILSEIHHFVGTAPRFDDVTLVVLVRE
ncbi:MAG TPA: SpoIIE family protein phosphatase [Anaerolineae bacterium]|nr:SpoIIE family protein phosphatase [Anaerolineae bacterium]